MRFLFRTPFSEFPVDVRSLASPDFRLRPNGRTASNAESCGLILHVYADCSSFISVGSRTLAIVGAPYSQLFPPFIPK